MVVGEGTVKYNLLEGYHLLPSQHPHSCYITVLVTVIPGPKYLLSNQCLFSSPE